MVSAGSAVGKGAVAWFGCAKRLAALALTLLVAVLLTGTLAGPPARLVGLQGGKEAERAGG